MYSRDRAHTPNHGHASGAGTAHAPGPGKHTQVERAYAHAGDAASGAVVQRMRAPGPAAAPEPAAAHEAEGDKAEGTAADGAAAASGAGHALPADGGGSAMPKDVQSKMEKVFGTSLAAVRIHQGPRAAALGAKAYTQGTDIHFAPGEYQPESPGGQRVLGHELAHVIQQSAGRVSATSRAHGVPVNEDAGLESEADEMGAKAARGEPVFPGGKGPAVHSKGDGAPIQRIAVPGFYRLTENANLRRRASPYASIEEIPQNATVMIPLHPEELTFRLNILSRAHTFVTYRGTDDRPRQGWVKDGVLRRDEPAMAGLHFDQETVDARDRVNEAVRSKDKPGERREKAAFVKLTQSVAPRVKAWIPQDIDTSNLYAFVKALNHNILNHAQHRVTYTRAHSPPERCITGLAGDCRSICELLQYITRDVLGVDGVQIESVKDGVRVAGSNAEGDRYTNHHWVKIGGQRFDAMEDADFSFARWEVHRNQAWRTMVAGDIIQGISINEL